MTTVSLITEIFRKLKQLELFDCEAIDCNPMYFVEIKGCESTFSSRTNVILTASNAPANKTTVILMSVCSSLTALLCGCTIILRKIERGL